MFHGMKIVSSNGKRNEVVGRSCLIDDDEEKETLAWSLSSGSSMASGSLAGKCVHNDNNSTSKKKHKKKWVRMPLDIVGLSYLNGRNEPPANWSLSIGNAWNGKKGSDLFTKKNIAGEDRGKKPLAIDKSCSTEEDCSESWCKREENWTLSEGDLEIVKTLKESIKTHKKDEEERHMALLYEFAALSEDEILDYEEKSMVRKEYGAIKEVEKISGDKEYNYTGYNNSRLSNFKAEVQVKKSFPKSCPFIPKNHRSSPNIVSDKNIKFKTLNDSDNDEMKEKMFYPSVTYYNSNIKSRFNQNAVNTAPDFCKMSRDDKSIGCNQYAKLNNNLCSKTCLDNVSIHKSVVNASGYKKNKRKSVSFVDTFIEMKIN